MAKTKIADQRHAQSGVTAAEAQALIQAKWTEERAGITDSRTADVYRLTMRRYPVLMFAAHMRWLNEL